MIYMCIICTVKKPSLLSLSDEHRQILEAIVSPTINLAQFKSSPLWICDSCQGLVNIVEAFKNKALAGASHLLSALILVQEEQNEPEDSLLLAIKQEPDDLLEAKSFIEFEIEIEEGKWKDQEVKVNVKTECVESDDNHSESSHPLTSPQGHPCQDSLPSKLADKVSDLFLCRICGQRIPTPQIDAHTTLHTAPYCRYGCCYKTSDKGDIVRHRCDGILLEKSGVKSQKGDRGSKAKAKIKPPTIAASKSSAQRVREYRQRIAASRTPAQSIEARKSETERKRNYRLRKAASLAQASGPLESTTASSRSAGRSNDVQNGTQGQLTNQQRQSLAAESPQTTVQPGTSDQIEVSVEPMDLTDLPLPSRSNVPVETQDAAASTSATPFAEPPTIAAPKSSAQRVREYRQRIAASRTPAQLIAARKSNAERIRNYRLRKAANLALASGSLE